MTENRRPADASAPRSPQPDASDLIRIPSHRDLRAADCALVSERLLFPATRTLDPDDPGVGKTLLTRPLHPTPTTAPIAAPITARTPTTGGLWLTPITTETDWDQYTTARIAVEADFGVSPARAVRMVEELRERARRLDLRMSFGRTADGIVAAVGHLDGPPGTWSRLQEVDVFGPYRGRGFGNALLRAVLTRMAGRAATLAIVGADEDDWPLDWYRRRGFTDATRVAPTRG